MLILMDDDIRYPPNYIEEGIRLQQLHGGVVGFHGKSMPRLNARQEGLHFEQTVDKARAVHMLGAGVSFIPCAVAKAAIHSSMFRQYDCCCDHMVSFTAWRMGLKLTRVPSKRGWLKPFGVEGDSVWRTKAKERQHILAEMKSGGWPDAQA